jgi:hypothetical protein
MRSLRYISRELGCAARVIHHTGQQVARSGIMDQYGGRGGTALADNGRFVHQLVPVARRDFEVAGARFCLPPAVTDADLAEGKVLALMVHKNSYQKLIRRPIFIVRNGFGYRHVQTEDVERVGRPEAERRLVLKFVTEQYRQGARLTPTELQASSARAGLRSVAPCTFAT